MSQQPATSLPEECWQNKGRARPLLPGDELTRVRRSCCDLMMWTDSSLIFYIDTQVIYQFIPENWLTRSSQVLHLFYRSRRPLGCSAVGFFFEFLFPCGSLYTSILLFVGWWGCGLSVSYCSAHLFLVSFASPALLPNLSQPLCLHIRLIFCTQDSLFLHSTTWNPH